MSFTPPEARDMLEVWIGMICDLTGRISDSQGEVQRKTAQRARLDKKVFDLMRNLERCDFTREEWRVILSGLEHDIDEACARTLGLCSGTTP
jgi:hypothetical protein